MNTLEVVFGDSCYLTMKNSKLNNNDILMFNVLFNIGDLSNVENFKTKIPKQLCFENKNTSFKYTYDTIINNIKKGNKIKTNLTTSLFLVSIYYSQKLISELPINLER